MEKYQRSVKRWLYRCFGRAIAQDVKERNHRFLEEALELVQAAGCSKNEALLLVEYVYGRPVGELKQEVGGVAVTLTALCVAQKVSLEECASGELGRIWHKMPEIRAKQLEKPNFHGSN